MSQPIYLPCAFNPFLSKDSNRLSTIRTIHVLTPYTRCCCLRLNYEKRWVMDLITFV